MILVRRLGALGAGVRAERSVSLSQYRQRGNSEVE